MTDHFELSIMKGMRAISSSAEMRRTNFAIAFSPSSRASSMLMSRMLAPPAT